MLTRKELKEKYPEYDDMRAIEKHILEVSEDTYAGNFYKKFTRSFAIVGAIGMPFLTDYLAKKGMIAPDPGFVRYALGSLLGLTVGWASGISIAGLIYETCSEEGEIHQWFDKWFRRGDDP